MKSLNLRLLFISFTFFISYSLFSQSVTSIIPTSAITGQTIDIIIRGNGTHFQQGVTSLDMGSDIQCPSSRIQVQNPLLLTASITISANATAGTRDIKVFTKNEVQSID